MIFPQMMVPIDMARTKSTLPCPMCHKYNNANGNWIGIGKSSKYAEDDSDWVHMLFSCYRHIWARPVDPEHSGNRFGF